MSLTAAHVLDFLDSHPLRFHEGDFASVVNMLHEVYTQYNPIDTAEIRECFGKLRNLLDKLPPEDADMLFYHICDLCLEYEHSAFAHGILVGLYLHTELSSLS